MQVVLDVAIYMMVALNMEENYRPIGDVLVF